MIEIEKFYAHSKWELCSAMPTIPIFISQIKIWCPRALGLITPTQIKTIRTAFKTALPTKILNQAHH